MNSVATVFISPLLINLIHLTNETGLFHAFPTSILPPSPTCKVTPLNTSIFANNASNQSIQVAQPSTYSSLASQAHQTPIPAPPSPEGRA